MNPVCHTRRKIIRARRATFVPSVLSASNIAAAQNRDTIMSTSLENSLEEERYYNVDNFGKDVLSPGKETNVEQEENTETKTNEKEEMQEDKKENLQCNLTKEIYPLGLRNWPIFNLLKLEFISQIHTVMVYGDWGNRAIIMTKDKNVYNLGYNRDDHSKTDHFNNDMHIGIYPKKIEELCGKNIKTFARSSYLVLALTEEGEVYSWSFNEKHKSNVTPTPIRVVGLSEKHIVDIACGSHHCLALTSDGQVYAWGENNFGQVGNESTGIFNGSLPRQVKHGLEGKTVVRIACGSTFNMVITDEGKLYGWGNNENNHISIDNISTTSNNIFSIPNSAFSNPIFSNSTSSRLAFNDNTITFPIPNNVFPIPKNPNISQYSFMSTTTAVPCSTKPASNVQLLKHYVCPCQITTISDKIVNVACGDEHTLALTDKGKIYAWGKNNNGQLGVNILNSSGPNIMVNVAEIGEVSDIAAYGNLSVAVDSNKTIYVWGDCFGQDITTPFPTKFSKIDYAFAYSKLRVMHKPLTISMYDYEYIVEGLNVLESIAAAFDDPSTSDCTLQVEGQLIHVHKAILKIRCQHFKKKFQENGTKNDESTPDSSPVYTISDKFSYIVYKAFLKYLYTGKIDLPSKNALELMKLADEYCETNLKEDCREIIKQEIKESNIASYYNEVMGCNDKELEEYCFQFILHNLKAVVLSTDFHKLNTNIKDKVMRIAAEKDLFKT
ncbi:RCC1 and BTB domain-containing protein 1-like [Polyergus mexicanus]|uniref:RCC1 and BTB domain-containing protein 1-like n=1 Tax=Polyergus mexicanus TaxID=615972 RepID=UPI0038B5B0D9